MIENKEFKQITNKLTQLLIVHKLPHHTEAIQQSIRHLSVLARLNKLNPSDGISKEQGMDSLYKLSNTKDIDTLFYSVYSEFISLDGQLYFLNDVELNFFSALYYYENPELLPELFQNLNDKLWNQLIESYVLLTNGNDFFEYVAEHIGNDNIWQNIIFLENILMMIPDIHSRCYSKGIIAVALLKLLSRCKNSRENDTFLIHIHPSYLLYKFPNHLTEYYYQLYKTAEHPFVKSIGFSILLSQKKHNDEVKKEILQRLDFDSKQEYTAHSYYNFLLNYHNTAFLILFIEYNISDINQLLEIALVASPHAQLWILYDIIKFVEQNQSIYSFSNKKIKSIINYLCIDDIRFFYQRYELDQLRENYCIKNFESLKDFATQFQYYRQEKMIKNKTYIENWLTRLQNNLKLLDHNKLMLLFKNSTEESINKFKTSI